MWIAGLILFFLPVIYLLVDGFGEKDARLKELDEIQGRLAEKDSETALLVINNLRDLPISVGDIVKIADVAATRTVGVSGKIGTVIRATTSSFTQVEVIGTRFSDAAVCVLVEDLGKRFWLYPDLIVFVDTEDGLAT